LYILYSIGCADLKAEIELDIDGNIFSGIITDSQSPKTTLEIISSLPLEGHPTKWGGELYFRVPFHVDDENTTEDLKIGDIAFWPPGDVLCIFFGKTPISTNDSPKPASAVNVVGHVDSALKLNDLTDVKKITIRLKEHK